MILRSLEECRQDGDQWKEPIWRFSSGNQPWDELLRRYLIKSAERDPRLQGIVAYAPLEYGTRTHAYLDALARSGSRVKGVRRNTQDELDPELPLQPAFLDGLRLLPEYGYTFDVCIRHLRLGAVVEMVRRCPETTFVLNHLGKPAVKDRLLEPWRTQLRALAEIPNAWCKVSGLVTEADHAAWTGEDLRPYVEHALEAFGADRVLFGSDWPVERLASTYERWVEALDRFTDNLRDDQRRGLWAENARRVYRLLPQTPLTKGAS